MTTDTNSQAEPVAKKNEISHSYGSNGEFLMHCFGCLAGGLAMHSVPAAFALFVLLPLFPGYGGSKKKTEAGVQASD